MSHWAEIDSNNVVLRVLVGDNGALDEGQTFMASLGGTWVKTSRTIPNIIQRTTRRIIRKTIPNGVTSGAKTSRRARTTGRRITRRSAAV